MKEFVKDSARHRLKYEPMDKVFRAIMYVRFWSICGELLCGVLVVYRATINVRMNGAFIHDASRICS